MDEDRLDQLLKEHAHRTSAQFSPIGRATVVKHTQSLIRRRQRRRIGLMAGAFALVSGLLATVVPQVGGGHNREIAVGIPLQPLTHGFQRSGSIPGETDWGPPREPLGYQGTISSSLAEPVLNVIGDNPLYGDERAFVDILDPATNRYVDSVDGLVGQSYRVRVYLHNAGAAQHGQSSTTTGLSVRCEVPSGTRTIEVECFAVTNRTEFIYDKTRIEADRPNEAVALLMAEYVPGSAQIITTEQPVPRALSDDLAGAGVLVASNGAFPGGAQGVIQFEVRVTSRDVISSVPRTS